MMQFEITGMYSPQEFARLFRKISCVPIVLQPTVCNIINSNEIFKKVFICLPISIICRPVSW
jgi:hypothetical protein